MPIDKNKLIRFQVLDRCFADQTRMYFLNDLQEECRKALKNAGLRFPDVSRRTIYNDINEMECNMSWNVSLDDSAYDGKRRYFRYANPSYRIWNNDLNESQLNQLKSILLMIKQFRGIPQFEKMEEMIEQLEEKYHFELPESDSIIGFDNNPNVEGLEYLSVLYSCITSKSAIEIHYQPFLKEERTYIFHPYYLKQYHNRWFVWGRVKEDTTIYNLALDRIKSIQPSSEKYISTEVNFDNFFDDIIGVTNLIGEPQKIQLRFSEFRFPYVTSKPLHYTQTIINREQRIIEIIVKENLELYELLMSFGYDVEVISPTSIRAKVMLMIDKMKDNYSS